MTNNIPWIAAELKRLFPQADLRKGVDLNGDGVLQAHERIATFDDNNILGLKPHEKNPYKGVIGDWTDWLAFYRHNWGKSGKQYAIIPRR